MSEEPKPPPAPEPVEIKCPKCSESFHVERYALVPKEQTFYMELTSVSELFPSSTIGQAINHMNALLVGVAKNMGDKVETFIKSIDVKPNKIKIGFEIIRTDK